MGITESEVREGELVEEDPNVTYFATCRTSYRTGNSHPNPEQADDERQIHIADHQGAVMRAEGDDTLEHRRRGRCGRSRLTPRRGARRRGRRGST